MIFRQNPKNPNYPQNTRSSRGGIPWKADRDGAVAPWKLRGYIGAFRDPRETEQAVKSLGFTILTKLNGPHGVPPTLEVVASAKDEGKNGDVPAFIPKNPEGEIGRAHV